jgi:mono/diheme cytochrome c family protein
MISQRFRQFFFAGAILATGICPAGAQVTEAISSAPVYVPDTTRQNNPLPEGVIAWDATLKAMDAEEGNGYVKFEFNFTNIFAIKDLTLITNGTGSTATVTTITNSITPTPITILEVRPSCGCTTAEMPPRPWTLQPGESGQMKFSLHLAGKMGTLFKTVGIVTDQGKRDLMLRVNITPPKKIEMTEDQRAAGLAAAKADRQAVFKGDCASCHTKNIEGRYGQELFKNACAICHEAEHRASMVPDLATLKVPTDVEFWRTWITFGKPGSLMPAFAQSQGGPLSDLQIASLAQYLNAIHPTTVTNIPPE